MWYIISETALVNPPLHLAVPLLFFSFAWCHHGSSELVGI